MNLVAAIACYGGEPAVERSASPMDGSWVGDVIGRPELFDETVSENRAAWVAYHRSDLPEALRIGGPAGQRAAEDLALLHADLGLVSSEAWSRTMRTWDDKGELPVDSAITWFAALAALETGDEEAARAWLERAANAGDAQVRGAATALAARPVVDTPLPDATGNVLLEQFNANVGARVSGQPDGLGIDDAIWVEAAGDHERGFHDPMRHWSLAAVHAHVEGPDEGLPSLLFSACLDAQTTDCAAQTAKALGVDPTLEGEDDPERARQLVRSLDVALDGWVGELEGSIDDDGRALLEDLALVQRLRAEVLLGLSRQALAGDRPRQALAMAQLALDLENPREVGPVNLPGLYAVLATANLRTGHTREALDNLHVLTGSPLDEAHGVKEIVGDLAILQGLDRQGDSKEN
ncbi:MAG TPA: hypothetical protein QGF58_04340 [Myxococcota bacterium]|nr:hypothetical protein [Myxococcota bacterium]